MQTARHVVPHKRQFERDFFGHAHHASTLPLDRHLPRFVKVDISEWFGDDNVHLKCLSCEGVLGRGRHRPVGLWHLNGCWMCDEAQFRECPHCHRHWYHRGLCCQYVGTYCKSSLCSVCCDQLDVKYSAFHFSLGVLSPSMWEKWAHHQNVVRDVDDENNTWGGVGLPDGYVPLCDRLPRPFFRGGLGCSFCGQTF
jgi:hypothetical protein